MLTSVELDLGSVRRTIALTAPARGAVTRPDAVVTAVLTVSERAEPTVRAFGPRPSSSCGHPRERRGPQFAFEATPLAAQGTLTARVESVPLESLRTNAGIWMVHRHCRAFSGSIFTRETVGELTVRKWVALDNP